MTASCTITLKPQEILLKLFIGSLGFFYNMFSLHLPSPSSTLLCSFCEFQASQTQQVLGGLQKGQETIVKNKHQDYSQHSLSCMPISVYLTIQALCSQVYCRHIQAERNAILVIIPVVDKYYFQHRGSHYFNCFAQKNELAFCPDILLDISVYIFPRDIHYNL